MSESRSRRRVRGLRMPLDGDGLPHGRRDHRRESRHPVRVAPPPLTDVHPHAELAAEAAEAAGAQGAYWQMHETLLAHQGAFELEDLIRHAAALGLDAERLRADLTEHRYAMRVARDIESGDASGVAGTPTF